MAIIVLEDPHLDAEHRTEIFDYVRHCATLDRSLIVSFTQFSGTQSDQLYYYCCNAQAITDYVHLSMQIAVHNYPCV